MTNFVLKNAQLASGESVDIEVKDGLVLQVAAAGDAVNVCAADGAGADHGQTVGGHGCLGRFAARMA